MEYSKCYQGSLVSGRRLLPGAGAACHRGLPLPKVLHLQVVTRNANQRGEERQGAQPGADGPSTFVADTRYMTAKKKKKIFRWEQEINGTLIKSL